MNFKIRWYLMYEVLGKCDWNDGIKFEHLNTAIVIFWLNFQNGKLTLNIQCVLNLGLFRYTRGKRLSYHSQTQTKNILIDDKTSPVVQAFSMRLMNFKI